MASVRAVVPNSNGAVLFLLRSPKSSRPSQWSLPGGRIKPFESSHAAVLREVREETGLNLTIVRPLCQFQSQEYFLCEPVGNDQVVINHESVAARWVMPDQLLELGEIMDLKQLRIVLANCGFDLPLMS